MRFCKGLGRKIARYLSGEWVGKMGEWKKWMDESWKYIE